MTNDREETWTQIYQITKEGFLFFLFFFSFLSPKFKSRKEYSLISLPHFLFQRSVEGARTSSAPAGSASRRNCDVMATTIVVTGATRPSAVCDRLRGFVRVGRDSSLWGARGTGSALKTPHSQMLTPRWVASSLPLFANLKSANRFVPPEPPSWVCTWLTGPLSQMPRITNSSEIKMVFQKFVLRLGGRFGFILFGRGILFLFLNFHEYNGKLFKGDFFF